MKKCTKCNKLKKYEDFNRASKRKDGRREQCRKCEQAYRLSPEVKQMRYERDLLKKYNLTLNDYNAMFSEQKGCCRICKAHQMNFERPLCVDHNHETGEVRGLLCDKCNRALGLFNDNPALLEEALAYLKEEGHYGT